MRRRGSIENGGRYSDHRNSSSEEQGLSLCSLGWIGLSRLERWQRHSRSAASGGRWSLHNRFKLHLLQKLFTLSFETKEKIYILVLLVLHIVWSAAQTDVSSIAAPANEQYIKTKIKEFSTPNSSNSRINAITGCFHHLYILAVCQLRVWDSVKIQSASGHKPSWSLLSFAGLKKKKHVSKKIRNKNKKKRLEMSDSWVQRNLSAGVSLERCS